MCVEYKDRDRGCVYKMGLDPLVEGGREVRRVLLYIRNRRTFFLFFFRSSKWQR